VNRRIGFRRRWGRWQPSDAQRRVLDALVTGKTNAGIAETLGISAETVKWHISEMLAETGLADRQALSSWWQEQREQRQGLIHVLPFGRKFSFVATLVAVGALLVGVEALWPTGNGGEIPQPNADSIGLDEPLQSAGQSSASESLFSRFIVELESEKRRLHLRNIETGRRTVSLNVGYAPMVLARPNQNELLVVDRPTKPENAGRLLEPQLRVYDLVDPSSVKRTINLPDLPSCQVFCQPMILSKDERYLYYDSVKQACPVGGDASVCDAHAVTIVDLENSRTPLINVPLPTGCGIPAFAPGGPDGVVVTCRTQYPADIGWMALLAHDGSVLRSFDFGTERLFNVERMVSSMKGIASFGTLTNANELMVLLQEGQIVKEAADGTRTKAHALPSDSPFILRVEQALGLGSDRVFIVYRDSSWGAHERNLSFVVFDLVTMAIESQGRVPEADYYLPQDNRRVFVLHSGRIELLDVVTGRLQKVADSVGDTVDVLLPGG
jgi:DNA-binding CsgD family transcriptional regulator